GGAQDYKQALDSYDVAKETLEKVDEPSDIHNITEALEDGRYAAKCVRARVDGRPLPVRRPPCFFNPQHGPSVEDLDWAPVGVHDYKQSLDSYDVAKETLEKVDEPSDIHNITEALEDGRYAAKCVRARVDGRPLPVRRPPCFFNPQHGPSVEDIDWAPVGGQLRPVPVCAADAERVAVGAEPAVRKVVTGDGRTRRAYWEAGPAYAEYNRGYFNSYAGSGLLPGVLMG